MTYAVVFSLLAIACVDDAAKPGSGNGSGGDNDTGLVAGNGQFILVPGGTDDNVAGGTTVPVAGSNVPISTGGESSGGRTSADDDDSGSEAGTPAEETDDERPRCEDNNDCDSGYCVPAPDGSRVCTTVCGADADCPDGWICSAIANTRPDTVFICVAPRQVQCLACERDTDCGAQNDKCIQIGRSLRCAQDCSTIECPDGTVCEDVSVDDETYRLCRPENGQCAPCVDEDGDGYGNEGDCLGPDCNDQDVNINPAASERCDMIDNNCNDEIDEIAECAPCVDEDGDGYGNTGNCLGPDCNDDSAVTYPGADEVCDGVDNDCDTRADEDILAPPFDVTCLPEASGFSTQPACFRGSGPALSRPIRRRDGTDRRRR